MFFDITNGISELKKMQEEENRIKSQLKELRKHRANLEEKIQVYLQRNNHTGVMLNNVIVENKTVVRNKPLSKVEKEKCISEILKNNNIATPELIINDIRQKTSGIKTVKTKIAITQQK